MLKNIREQQGDLKKAKNEILVSAKYYMWVNT